MICIMQHSRPLINNFSKRNIVRQTKDSYYYTILNLRPSATRDQIRAAYVAMSKLYHPDNAETGSHQKFLRIKTAYDKIKDAPLAHGRSIREDGGDELSDLSHDAYVQSKAREYGHRIKQNSSKKLREEYEDKHKMVEKPKSLNIFRLFR